MSRKFQLFLVLAISVWFSGSSLAQRPPALAIVQKAPSPAEPASVLHEPPVPVISLDLRGAVRLAVRNQFRVLSQTQDTEAEKGRRLQALSELLPHLNAAASQQRTWRENLSALGFDSAGLIGPFNTFDARFQAAQRILDLSAISSYRAERAAVQARIWEEKLVKEQAAAAAALAYVEALRSREKLNVALADLKLARQLWILATHQQGAGLATGIDAARARTRMAEERVRMEQSILEKHRAYLELERITGIPYDRPLHLSQSLAFAGARTGSVSGAVSDAMENRLEIKAAGERFRQAGFEVRSAAGQFFPKIEAAGDYGLSGKTIDTNDRQVGEAVVRVTLPIFEGGRIRGQIEEASAGRRRSELFLADLKRQVEEDVRLASHALQASARTVKAAALARRVAARELSMARDRFREGVGDNIEVLDAQTALARARDVYVAALAGYQTARINYYSALGNVEYFNLND